jgi:hypothetical protein
MPSACRQGHPYSDENTYWVAKKKNGTKYRACKTCRATYNQRRREAAEEKRKPKAYPLNAAVQLYRDELEAFKKRNEERMLLKGEGRVSQDMRAVDAGPNEESNGENL